MSKIYSGTSAFFANREGKHNWLDNNKRPFISLITTSKKGKKSYDDLFLNPDAVEVNIKSGKITLTFDATVSKPLFRILNKDD